MASHIQDLHVRQIAMGRTWEQLPLKMQKAMPRAEYNLKCVAGPGSVGRAGARAPAPAPADVHATHDPLAPPRRAKEHYIAAQARWSEVAMIQSIVGEGEYYTELVAALKSEPEQLYPYHLSAYVCRVQRVTPFKYYTDILVNALKAERAYDSIPNFTAADIVRVIGVGRNEFIDILNRCRGKFMWKLNKGAAKDLLPGEPRAINFQPWWAVHPVAVTNDDIRRAKPPEIKLVDRLLSAPGRRLRAGDVGDVEALAGLYGRGLIYVDVPIVGDDRISIPPLENFVSNRSNENDDSIEGVLYSVFVASSERATMEELAHILETDIERVLRAVSLACRLGFAERISPLGRPASSRRGADSGRAKRLSLGIDAGADAEALSAISGDSAAAADDGGGVEGDDDDDEESSRRSFAAILVDTTLTSFLMMGNLSAGLKRHAVTLFEGGRLSDANVVEFTNELLSVESSDSTFEVRGPLRRRGRLTGARRPDAEVFALRTPPRSHADRAPSRRLSSTCSRSG